MRIIIELEGTETTVKAVHTDTTAAQAPVPIVMSTNGVPPEVLAAAAATGAINAGPAPNIGKQTPETPHLTPSATVPGAPAAGVGDHPAGAAPTDLFK